MYKLEGEANMKCSYYLVFEEQKPGPQSGIKAITSPKCEEKKFKIKISHRSFKKEEASQPTNQMHAMS